MSTVRVPNVTAGALSGLSHEVIGRAAVEAAEAQLSDGYESWEYPALVAEVGDRDLHPDGRSKDALVAALYAADSDADGPDAAGDHDDAESAPQDA